MTWFKQHLIEQSGLPDRTIRNYIKRGLIPGPEGHGLAAEYSDEALVRAVAIGRMRAQGMPVGAIAQQIAGWKLARFKRFIAETEPAADAPPPPAETPLAPTPSAPAAAPDRHEPIGDLALPDGPSFRVVALLPGLALMVDLGAAAVVQRIAAEICERYGRR